MPGAPITCLTLDKDPAHPKPAGRAGRGPHGAIRSPPHASSTRPPPCLSFPLLSQGAGDVTTASPRAGKVPGRRKSCWHWARRPQKNRKCRTCSGPAPDLLHPDGCAPAPGPPSQNKAEPQHWLRPDKLISPAAGGSGWAGAELKNLPVPAPWAKEQDGSGRLGTARHGSPDTPGAPRGHPSLTPHTENALVAARQGLAEHKPGIVGAGTAVGPPGCREGDASGGDGGVPAGSPSSAPCRHPAHHTGTPPA